MEAAERRQGGFFRRIKEFPHVVAIGAGTYDIREKALTLGNPCFEQHAAQFFSRMADKRLLFGSFFKAPALAYYEVGGVASATCAEPEVFSHYPPQENSYRFGVFRLSFLRRIYTLLQDF